MSTYDAVSTIGPPTARPATLTVAAGAAVGVAVLNIAGAAAVLNAGWELVRQQIAQNPTFGGDPIDPATVDLTSERAEGLHTIFTSMSVNTIFWSLVLVTFAAFAVRGGRTARAFAAVILGVTVLVKVVDVVLEVPTITLIADVLAALLAIVAIALLFVPASNAYGRSRRAARSRVSG
jgi:hypothetical protein